MLMAIALAGAILPGTPLSDAELASLRGGFRLPNGVELALTVRSDTSLNGALLLRSVFSIVGDTTVLQVLAPARGQEGASAAHAEGAGATSAGNAAAASSAAGNGVAVQFDRQNGVVFVPGASTSAPAITVTTGSVAPAIDAAGAGLSVVPVVAGGGAVETAGGPVSISALPEGLRIRLEGAELDVSHIVGAAFGSVIANTASDRTIDTTTTIALDLGNAGPDMIGSTMFQVENVAIDAARLGIR